MGSETLYLGLGWRTGLAGWKPRFQKMQDEICQHVQLLEQCRNNVLQRRGSLTGPRVLPDKDWLSNGLDVQYYSKTHGKWITSKVVHKDPDSGAVMLDCKPNYWIRVAEQA